MVTSFRPKSAMVIDEIVLTGVRTISNLSELYNQYAQYRLDVLEDRIRTQAKKMREMDRAGRLFDVAGARKFLNEQKQFLESMLVELVPDED